MRINVFYTILQTARVYLAYRALIIVCSSLIVQVRLQLFVAVWSWFLTHLTLSNTRPPNNPEPLAQSFPISGNISREIRAHFRPFGYAAAMLNLSPRMPSLPSIIIKNMLIGF